MQRFKPLLIALTILSVLTVSCSNHSAKNEATSQAPEENASAEESDERDEQVLTQWQEEKHQNFFDWPVDEARMTRGYLPNRRRPHLGVDLAAPKGTKILAAHDGVVIYTGRDFKGYGKMVMIEGAQGWATLYAHFSSIEVKEGQVVKQGDPIGGMGRTGRATGVHLHFEIRKTRGPVDPLLYLPRAAARLAGRK
jgi:murein DD-endopeptidase MepM/ murein hydrolase activator NlpD